MTTTKTDPIQPVRDAAEAIRTFNHLTIAHGDEAPALPYPGSAYDAVGSLKVLAHRLPQAFEQIGSALTALQRAGHVGALRGDTETQVAEVLHRLLMAQTAAGSLAKVLENAHTSLSPLIYTGPFPDDEEGEFDYCDRCEEERETGEVYPHCCRCGADGSGDRPDCTCD